MSGERLQDASESQEREPTLKVATITWDWRDTYENFNSEDEVNEILASVFDGKNVPVFIEIDSRNDEHSFIVASRRISTERAQEIWDQAEEESGVAFGGPINEAKEIPD